MAIQQHPTLKGSVPGEDFSLGDTFPFYFILSICLTIHMIVNGRHFHGLLGPDSKGNNMMKRM